MAIRHRRGIYSRFDPSSLVAGEWAVVLSGDPDAKDGKAAYVCFAAGDVKRVATYEDMMDWLLGLREDVITAVVDSATSEIRAEHLQMMGDAQTAEAARAAAEQLRSDAEAARASAESSRATAEQARAAAELERARKIAAFEAAVAAGELDGATFTPSVSEAGLLSWTNDKGLPNPVTVDVRGPKGNDGAVSQIGTGLYAFQVARDGHLHLLHGEEAEVPDMEIRDDGHLWALVGS